MAGYQTLIKLELLHNFYKSGVTDDFEFVLTADIQRLMRQQRLLYRNFGCGFTILYESTQPNTPTIEIDSDLTFVFGLGIKNPGTFYGITDLDESAPSTVSYTNGCRMFYYTDGALADLKYKVLHAMYPERFSFKFTEKTAFKTIQVTIKDQNGTTVNAQYDTAGSPITSPYTLNADNNGESGNILRTFTGFFDVSKTGSGYYTILLKREDATEKTLQVYIHDELSRSNVSGVVQLSLAKPTPPLAAKNLRIDLKRAESIWKYFIINRSGLDFTATDLVLSDKSGDSGPIYNTYTFSGNPAMGGGGQALPNTADSINSLPTMVFESTVKIPFYEVPKTKLELKKIPDARRRQQQGTC
ncbi:hypothetical protein QQ054_05200 [Oscillatoria amoena NRMC-F 0135]|nr:hypothetical protein [Oscillatoria amoena NRMC-F 0135]